MPQPIDPQVQAAFVQAGGGMVAGAGGMFAALWRRRRQRDEVCKRVCGKMVAISDTMIAVIKAIGADDPRLAPHIADARTYLDGEEL